MKRTAQIVFSAATLSIMTGCASMLGHGTDQVYEGAPLPRDQVAVIEFNGESGWGMGNGITVESIDGHKLSLISQSKQEVKAGTHTIAYECDLSQKTMDGKRDGYAVRKITLEGGHHYRLVGDLMPLSARDYYYKESHFMGQTMKTVQKHSCNLRLVKYKELQG